MENLVIREDMKKAAVCQWEVASRLGISEFTFTRWLRKELPEARKTLVIEAIEAIAREKQLVNSNGEVGV